MQERITRQQEGGEMERGGHLQLAATGPFCFEGGLHGQYPSGAAERSEPRDRWGGQGQAEELEKAAIAFLWSVTWKWHRHGHSA